MYDLSEDKELRYQLLNEAVDREMKGLDPDPNNPFSSYRVEDATEDGILRPDEEEDTESYYTEGEPQFKKLGFWASQKDMLKSVGAEALKIVAPKSDSWLANLTGGRWSEDNLWKHQAQTVYGELMSKGVYRYGVSTIAIMLATRGLALGFVKAADIARLAGNVKKAQALLKGAKVARVFSGAKVAKFKNMSKAQKIRHLLTDGLPAGAIADYNLYDRWNDSHMVDVLGSDNLIRKALGTREGEGETEARIKNVIEGIIMTPLANTALEYLFKPAFKNTIGKLWDNSKKLNGAKTNKERQQALNDLLKGGQNIENMADTASLMKQVQELWDGLEIKTPEALENAINENFVQKDLIRAKEIGSLISSGEQIHLYDDGTIDIKVTKWDDAHKLSESSYVQQMKEVEQRAVNEQIEKLKAQGYSDDEIKKMVKLPDTSIHHMNESVKHTWVHRGLIGTNETLTQKIANKIGKWYKDKWQVDNNIKVEFVDGLVNSEGKAVEGRTEKATYQGKTKKTTNQTSIDKQELKIKELEDKITMLEGGNKEVSDPLDVLKEKLRIAKEELKNLKTKAQKDFDITIRIDKNAKNPYAALRAELEHARDMAKGEVPKKANIEGSGEHFSRYIGDNEQEMSPYYTYKKATGKANALGENKGITSDNSEVRLSENQSESTATTKVEGETAKSQEIKGEASSDIQKELGKPQQLSIDFEQANKFTNDLSQTTSAKEIVDGLMNGSLAPQTVNDIASILDHTIKNDPDLLATDFNSLAMGGDNVVKTLDDLIEAGEANQYKQAFLQDDIEFLNSIVRKELAASKIVGLLKDSLNNLPQDADMGIKRNLLNTTAYLSDYVNQLRSGAGSLLNSQKLVNRVLEAFGDSKTTSAFKERVDTIADVLDKYMNEVRQSLDFTTKDIDSYLQGFYENLAKVEGGEDLIRQIASDDILKELFNNIATNPKSTSKEAIANQLKEAFTNYEYDKLMEALEKTNDPNSIINVINKWWSNDVNAFYVHNILGIGSIIRNVASTARMFGSPIAKKLSGLWGEEFSDISKEGSYTLANMWSNMGEAWSMAKNAFMTGSGQLSNVNAALAVQGLDGLSEWSLNPRNIHSFCSRVMMASDEFLTQLNYRAICKAQAQVAVEKEFRTMGKEIGTQEFFEAVQKRFDGAFDKNGIPQNFSAYAEARDVIYQTPLSGKLYNPVTHTKEQVRESTGLLWFGSTAENLVQKHPIVKMFIPFIKTPTNVAQSVIESNPALLAASPSFWSKFNSSDVREQAFARGALTLTCMGSLICSMAALTGTMTGSPPADPKLKEALLKAGWQPYSIKVGDKYLSYEYLPPEIKAHLAWGCDVVNILSMIADEDDGLEVQDKMWQISWKIIGSIFDTAIDQSSFRTGFTKLTDMIDAVATGNENEIVKILTQTGRGFLPMASTVKDIETFGLHPAKTKDGLDPYSKLVMNYFPECFGLTKKANYRRNVFGERQDYFNYIFGKAIDNKHDSPEGREIAKLMSIGYNPKQITKTIAGTRISFNDYRNNETGRTAYDDMQEVMSTIKIGGLTLREAVRALVQDPYYQQLPNGDSNAIGGGKWLKSDGDTKMRLMNDIFIEYAEAAEQEVLYNSQKYVNDDGHTMEETKYQIEALKEQERVNSLLNIGNLY